MTEYMTEQEQIEQIKTWVKEYGFSILAGIIIALVLVSGWHYWQRYELKMLTHASGIYDEMLTARAQNNSDSLNNAQVQANRLISHYPKTPYAQLAAFMLARDAVGHKNYPVAETQLNWVIDHASDIALREIARIRLARILISEKKSPDALAILDKVTNNTFLGLADEAKGDAYVQMNNLDKAQSAYQIALKELPKEEAADRPLLQMKLDNLATASNTAS